LVYIDDLLIFSKTYKEHIAHLDMFFRKVEQNGLTFFICRFIQYLFFLYPELMMMLIPSYSWTFCISECIL
jgi:hypothetical protein